MLADANLRDSGQPALVTDWNLDDRKAEAGYTEEQVEIAEWIELAEMFPPGFDLFVVGLEQDLGPAQRVSNGLLEQPREQLAEEPVANVIDELHRAFFHGIDEAGPVDEAALAGGEGI